MNDVTVQIEDRQFTISVKDLSAVRRTHLVAQLPEELASADRPEQVQVDEEIVAYFTNVLTTATEFTQEEVDTMSVEHLAKFSSSVLEHIYGDEVGSTHTGRLRRVRATDEFIEHLFVGDAVLIAGMPDDASFEDFSYDPSCNEVMFIFSSDEWEPVDDAEEIPVHETYGVEISSGTKEMEPADQFDR